MVTRQLNAKQLTTLRLLATSPAPAGVDNSQRLSARALATRRLVTIKGRGRNWTSELTDAGHHYLEHGEYPPGHFWTAPESKPATKEAGSDHGPRVPKPPKPARLEVDSPAGVRRSGRKPAGDALFEKQDDPYDEKVLITAKEAAWILSLPESAIRRAIADGDLDRVFIGKGTHNYRIVYGSLLAWVNSMPRESGLRRWWR